MQRYPAGSGAAHCEYAATTLFIIIFAAAFTAACGPYHGPQIATLAPDEVARHPAVGCWQFPAMRGNPFLAAAMRVRLDTAALDHRERGSRRRLILEATADSSLHRRIQVANWGPLPGSSPAVYLVWGDGFGGFAVEGQVRGDSLVGRGREFTDFPAPFRRRRVVAMRVPCAPGEPAGSGPE